jgi:fermentation-respiration switch protein FrsA (DUF1100 family)
MTNKTNRPTTNCELLMKKLSALTLLLHVPLSALGQKMLTTPFEFTHGDHRLRGVLDLPPSGKASALIVVVHGDGKTNVEHGQWIDLRTKFTELGLAVCVWDKTGCGKSDGTYDHEQTVQDSAREVSAAIADLRQRAVSGSEKIGLWGISRAGWICPLVISQDPKIAFWISVSGTDEKESFGYLLRSNLKAEGLSDTEAEALYQEWLKSSRIFQTGGSWDAYREANANLRRNTFYREFFNEDGGEEQFSQNQKRFMAGSPVFDQRSGLLIYVPKFGEVLSRISCPVLAIFGEKDLTVDWRSTLNLYRKTISAERLTVRTFPDGNHNLQRCTTGSLREIIANRGKWNPCAGYYESMTEWLQSIGAATGRDPKNSAAR